MHELNGRQEFFPIQSVRGVEEVSDLFPGVGTDPEPSMDIGREAGFFLLHRRPDVAVKVV